MLVHRGIQCQLRSRFHVISGVELPRRITDPPDLIRATARVSEQQSLHLQWTSHKPITAWCEISRSTASGKVHKVIAETYMDKFNMATQDRNSDEHLQDRKKLTACRARTYDPQERGLGIIRLEIRRIEDTLTVRTFTLPDGLFKDRIDYDLIDDPDLDMRPYVTFEFELQPLPWVTGTEQLLEGQQRDHDSETGRNIISEFMERGTRSHGRRNKMSKVAYIPCSRRWRQERHSSPGSPCDVGGKSGESLNSEDNDSEGWRRYNKEYRRTSKARALTRQSVRSGVPSPPIDTTASTSVDNVHAEAGEEWENRRMMLNLKKKKVCMEIDMKIQELKNLELEYAKYDEDVETDSAEEFISDEAD